jgi:hypothetical protein
VSVAALAAATLTAFAVRVESARAALAAAALAYRAIRIKAAIATRAAFTLTVAFAIRVKPAL